MGKQKSLQDISRFWTRALVSSCHISRYAQLPTQTTQSSAGPGWLRYGHSASTIPANFPTAPMWNFEQIVTDSQMAGQQLKKPKDPLSLDHAGKTIYNKQPKLHWCISYLEWGTEITEIGSVFWHCIRLYTSASVNLLKEVKVLCRKLKANHA